MATTAAIVPRTRLGSRRVLVVDDDPSVLDLVRDVLTDDGYFVATARHGAAALESVEMFHPDVVLLDLRMPIMDGWSFAEQYRRKAHPSASIVLLSAVPGVEGIASRIGAEAVVPKPIDPDRLLSTVARCVADC